MDSPLAPVAPPDSQNLVTLKETFRLLTEEGLPVGIEYLLAHAHEDCEFRPFGGEGVSLRGQAAVREYYTDRERSGLRMTVRAASFEEHGDEVTVRGSVRVQRPASGFAESQIAWTYRFEDGLLRVAESGPRVA
jgi:hypothetical protein